jgi:hypothetical protein
MTRNPYQPHKEETMTTTQPQALTALNGALIRLGHDQWQWSDGTPALGVRDLSPDRWHFRCRTYGGGQCYAEVSRQVALRTPELAWVLAGAQAGRYLPGQSGDHDPMEPGPIPAVILVPVEEWDEWAATHPVGASWDRAAEPAILERAARLGWRRS